jgi:hypothetical protein
MWTDQDRRLLGTIADECTTAVICLMFFGLQLDRGSE